MKQLVLYSFSICILFSCTKFGKTDTAKGRVVNPITGEGIADVEMHLLKSTSGLPGGNKSVKSVTTDANGYYEISKAGLKKYSLMCNLNADYYPIGWYVDGEIKVSNTGNYGLKKGKTLNADFYTVPYANYQLIINNINCQGSGDTIIINQTNQVGSFLGIDWVLTGCDGYITDTEKTPAGTIHTTYTVIRNGISNVFENDFTVQPGMNNIQTINY